MKNKITLEDIEKAKRILEEASINPKPYIMYVPGYGIYILTDGVWINKDTGEPLKLGKEYDEV